MSGPRLSGAYGPSSGVECLLGSVIGSLSVTPVSKGQRGCDQDIVLNLLPTASAMGCVEADETHEGSPVCVGEDVQIAGEWVGRASPSFAGEPGRVFRKVARHAQGATVFEMLNEAPEKRNS